MIVRYLDYRTLFIINLQIDENYKASTIKKIIHVES